MTLVIGCGNALRTDDRLGLYLAETLANDHHVIICTQLTPELAEPISSARRVIFIDAALGETPTSITCERAFPQPAEGAFTHHVSPAGLLAAARDWYGNAPDALVIAVTGASFELGETFSSQIDAALPQIARAVSAIAAAFFETGEIHLTQQTGATS